MPQYPTIYSQIIHNVDKLHKNGCLNGRILLHKSNTILVVAASMADYFFTNQTQYLQNPQKNSRGIPYEGYSCLNDELFLHKSNTILTTPQTKFIMGSLWKPYLPQWTTIYSKIKHNFDKLHKKLIRIPYEGHRCLKTGSRPRRPPFLHAISFEWTTKL